jgi:hypothetical protein
MAYIFVISGASIIKYRIWLFITKIFFVDSEVIMDLIQWKVFGAVHASDHVHSDEVEWILYFGFLVVAEVVFSVSPYCLHRN